MPQETNLNVSPYFDDFDANKGYYKVLFKPGYPVQARELTTLQSSLQNQLEQFGKNIFKDGSKVYGGEIIYSNPVYCVEIEPTFNGGPISLYFDQLLNKKVRGSISDVTAEIIFLLKDTESERNNYTLYLSYLQSGGTNYENKTFQDGESLILENSTLNYGLFTIQSGEQICNTIPTNSNSQGSLVRISNGIYFIRGLFVNAEEQTIILDQYATNPSYKVGFNILESIVTADQDSSLYDNAQGFSNYAAPGADRFELKLKLDKRNLTDNDTENFVQVLSVKNGIPQFLDKNPQYNLIRDYLAKRTFEESGNYYVKPFSLFVRDSLNDRTLNNGLYFANQATVNGNMPSEDKMVYEIGPGKAYVNGYDVETITSTLLDIEKPRETQTVRNQVVQYNAGILAVVNNIYGSPQIGLGTDSTVSLMSDRIGSSGHVASGSTIGLARIYDFVPEQGYGSKSSRMNLRLFDVQTFTTITLTAPINLTTPTFIKGRRSNATGYLKDSVNNSFTLTLYEVSGRFLDNERIIINGLDSGLLIKSSIDYSLSDIKSIYFGGSVGITTFNADLVLNKAVAIAPQGTLFSITAQSGGISTVSVGINTNFAGLLNPGDIVSYQNPSSGQNVVYNRVNSISAGSTFFTISAVQSVVGVNSGNLPSSNSSVTNFVKIYSNFYSQDDSLLTPLNKNNIASIDLEDNEIYQRRSYNISFSNNTLTVPQSGTLERDLYFDDFSYDNTLITYSDGTTEPLTFDMYDNSGGDVLTINGLSKSSGTAKVIVTIRNLKPNSKTKKLNTTSSILINKSRLSSSGIGTTTLNDGLTYSNVYGVRVQDEEICLNVPDVVRVLAIYESLDVNDPELPALDLVNFTGVNNSNLDFVLGESITGQTSGAVALVVNRISRNGNPNSIEYVYLNTFQFIENEVIFGSDSKTQAQISLKTIGGKNITQNYILDNGQRDTIYDYGRIIRKNNVSPPSKKIKIIFQNYTIDPGDTGEFITANSYPKSNFKTDVPLYGERRLTDYVDIRPRVSTYDTSSTKSPFEFSSRNFANDGQYSKYILAAGKSIISSYSYYLPRIDIVFLNSDGSFEVSKGVSSENPVPPILKDNVLDIASLYIPPYVYDVKDVIVDMTKHKRYRMSDISLLENRIQRVEEFTTLSMLESKTENLIIKDAATGLDRFKSGFFVDDFSSHDYHDLQNIQFKSAIDSSTNTLKPRHYTTFLNLQLGSEAISGIGQTYNPNADHSYVSDLGSINVKKTGDLITLNYDEVLYDEQLYATKSESVTPFLFRYWTGTVQLFPSSDNWIDEKTITTTSYREIRETVDMPDQNITVVNNVVENNVVYVNRPSPNIGIDQFNFTVFRRLRFRFLKDTRSREDMVRRLSFLNRQSTKNLQSLNDRATKTFNSHLRRFINLFPTQTQVLPFRPNRPNPGAPPLRPSNNPTTTTTNTGTVTIPPEIITTDNITETISNYDEPVTYLRSRNIEFDIKGLKPNTRFYPFFQGIDVSSFVIPKILTVEMVSKSFIAGETVESDPNFTSAKIKFRLCYPGHETGPYYREASNDVLLPQAIPALYTGSSTFLNVDTKSLQLDSESSFYGWVAPNMRLIGKTSGAVAIVSDIRLISDTRGRLIGSLYIPDPGVVGNPKWTNGENTFTVIDTNTLTPQQTNEIIPNSIPTQSSASAEFTSLGITNVTQKDILTTRNVKIISSYDITTTSITNTTTNTVPIQINRPIILSDRPVRPQNGPIDPLAQSFYVTEDTGIFLTSIDIFFESKDEDIPVTLQIRPMVNGYPSNMVVPFSEVTLSPDEVNISADASIPTNISFPSPIYLSGPRQQEVRQAPIGSQQTSEFAIVLLSNSTNYRVFISQIGQTDLLTKTLLSSQPTLGSLFKSQNSSTWTASQLEDLKYRIYRADFVNEGLVRFFNPILSLKNNKVNVTSANNLLPLSKKIIVGLGSTGYDATNIVPGISIIQGSASGTLAGIAGSITVGYNASIVNSGIGYTEGLFTNVELITETGYGQGAKATIGVSTDGLGISTVTITNGGIGYQYGDSLLIPSIGKNVGYGGRVVITSIASSNSFVIDNVQGQFVVGISTLSYLDSSGVVTPIGAGVTISSTPIEDPYYDGRHMKIYNKNHAMHSSENYVTISEMRPLNSSTNSRLSAELTSTEVATISLSSSAGFELFEGKPVTSANPGYVIIGNEVIRYTGVTGNDLISLTRSIDGSQAQSYSQQTYVYKYEFNGISLRRINKIHNLSEVNRETHPTDLDSFYIKIDTSDTDFDNVGIGSNRPDLYFKETLQTGQSGTIISNNIQFEEITPNISNIVPSRTNLTAKIRTFSATSVSADETLQPSFVDNGYEDIPLNDTTYFTQPKLICSQVNEQRMIKDSPGNRSFTMTMYMTSEDSRVSPVIDLENVSIMLTSNLINSPSGILQNSTYATNDKVRSLYDDDHSVIYISKPIELAVAANSIKVLFDASRNDTNDIRVLYRLFRKDSSSISQNYELFPGYSNYNIDGNGIKQVIDSSLNDGSADSFVQQTSDRSFKTYEYSVDDLPDFNAFSIKIVMAGTNQATPPIISQLRAIATVKPNL